MDETGRVEDFHSCVALAHSGSAIQASARRDYFSAEREARRSLDLNPKLQEAKLICAEYEFRYGHLPTCQTFLEEFPFEQVDPVQCMLVSVMIRRQRAEDLIKDAGPGDFIYVPPFVPHQEINASREESLSCVVVRSGQEPVVVNLEIAPAEPPEEVYWVDDIHSSLPNT